MRRQCRERLTRHQLQRKPLDSDPGIYHGTCVTHVPWCMSGLLTLGAGENVPGIPGACATHNFTYPASGLWQGLWWHSTASPAFSSFLFSRESSGVVGSPLICPISSSNVGSSVELPLASALIGLFLLGELGSSPVMALVKAAISSTSEYKCRPFLFAQVGNILISIQIKLQLR